MNKFTIGCLLAAAGCSAVFAASDYLALYQDYYLSRMFPVDDIENITYSGKKDKGFTNLKLNFKNGTAEEIAIDDFNGLLYQPSRGECTVEMPPILHYESVQLDIRPQDEDTYYRISGATEKQLADAGFDKSVWGEVLMATDIEYIYTAAESWGKPLSSFSPDEIFEHGSQIRDWFPETYIYPGTPLAICIYTCRLEGDEVIPTSDPKMLYVTTRELEVSDVNFNVTADLKSNRITVHADAPEEFGDRPFYVSLVSKYDVDTQGWDTVVGTLAANLESTVYSKYNPTTWDAVTFKGSGENTFTNLAEGEEYYGVAFGCDYGIVDTKPVYKLFTVPAAEVTDPCTFETTATQLSPSEFEVKITPSSPDTRYSAMLINKASITETYPISRIIGKQIQYYNKTNTINWETSDLLHTGEATVNTHDGVMAGEYLNVGKEYVLAVFGIDGETTRTTAIHEVNIVPQSQATADLTFEVKFGEFDGSSDYTHYLPVTVTPSDPDAKYVFDYLKASNPYVDLNKTDEEFISEYVDSYGEYLKLYQGEQTRKMTMGNS